jgi:hypothetical protein
VRPSGCGTSDMPAGPRLARHVLIALLATAALAAQQTNDAASGALPDPEPFFAAVRQNLARAQQEQNRFAYRERRTELHMNPFGKVGTGVTRVYDVVPDADGTSRTRRLIERDGQPVAGAPEERERRDRRNRPESDRGLDDVTAALQFTIDRREVVDGRPMILVRFVGRPDAKVRTREGRMARAFSGTIWVDEMAREVARVEAVAVNNISIGFGVVARLNQGTKVSLTRRPVAAGLWLPTSIRFVGEGRAMLLRKLNVDYVLDWFDYRMMR